MNQVEREITKETYDRYAEMTYAELSREISPTIPIEWACGYGWYGCFLREKDGKYYLVHTIGSTCD